MRNTKSDLFNYSFKISSFFTRSKFLRIVGFPFRLIYVIIIQWMLGIDIKDTTQIGSNFVLYHGQGLVVHPNVRIGDNVVLRQNTTIGVSHDGGGCPNIGDNVAVGANCVIIGNIKIGENSKIGAGSIVVKSVPPNSVVVGNPARVIKTHTNAS